MQCIITTLLKFCPKSEVCGTVKASSYGLGGHNKIVNKLKKSGCNRFFVANINEVYLLEINLKQ